MAWKYASVAQSTLQLIILRYENQNGLKNIIKERNKNHFQNQLG
jgi:hypothetical protein